ncbi:MAG: alkaline phosphatase family protein [Pseudobacteriovorax sp.]|nr:alkaline phosphatase family protein [Pseudobacteriovorax sp.]
MIRYFIVLCLSFSSSLLGSIPSMTFDEIDRIAFGSCNHQDKAQPLWNAIVRQNPQLWIWTGDVVYADTSDSSERQTIYKKQKTQSDYAAFRARIPIIGTWDDHDYADNNSDRTAKNREESQNDFLEFIDQRANHPKDRKGVYRSYSFGPKGRHLKVFLLDTRFHKDPWGTDSGTILGEDQWKWLEAGLKQSRAEVNIIVSSIQVLPKEHRFEKWQNFPKERDRLLTLLSSQNVKTPIIISGDRHIAEISGLTINGRNITEVTSSGMTHSYSSFSSEANKLRFGEVYYQLNFGEIDINWGRRTADISVRDQGAQAVLTRRIYLD